MKGGAIAMLTLLLWPLIGWAQQQPPVIQAHAKPHAFKDVPQPWRDYLDQARSAEFEADPFKRCLAFPDIPGTHWPAGHAAAHCRYNFAHQPPSLAQIEALLDGGKVVELEALARASQQRHASRDDFSEDIHRLFSSKFFDASPQSDRVTAKWLQLAPGSAYANLARGNFLSAAAWEARGTKYASDTPRANLQRMSDLTGQAIPYLEKAASIDPTLMPAYTALINIATADSRDDVETEAFERAERIDPDCTQLAKVRMIALQPRWGGSYERMLWYANDLVAHQKSRPLLALNIEAPFADRANLLLADDQYTQATLDGLELAIAIGSDEDVLHDAANAALNTTDVKPDSWKAVAYLLQESRFRNGNAWADRNIAWMLVRPDPEWSLRYSLKAVELEPDDAWGHYLLGAGYNNVGRNVDADREYAIAIKDPRQRQASLREVAEMWLFTGFPGDASTRSAGATRAKPYIDRLMTEYPTDGRAWVMKFFEQLAEQNRVEESAIRATLKKVDRSDAWQARQADRLQGMLDQIEKFKHQKH